MEIRDGTLYILSVASALHVALSESEKVGSGEIDCVPGRIEGVETREKDLAPLCVAFVVAVIDADRVVVGECDDVGTAITEITDE